MLDFQFHSTDRMERYIANWKGFQKPIKGSHTREKLSLKWPSTAKQYLMCVNKKKAFSYDICQTISFSIWNSVIDIFSPWAWPRYSPLKPQDQHTDWWSELKHSLNGMESKIYYIRALKCSQFFWPECTAKMHSNQVAVNL